nr:nucleotidyltransferase domain-containing protein [uncultured Methanoregula sp.]
MKNIPADNISLNITNPNIPMPEKAILTFCWKWKIDSFRFYGSIMRDDFRPDSDIDVLVEYRPDAHHSFHDLFEMTEELEHLFGRKVDLADRRSVDASPNYIRRKGILSGKPPVHRQMSYLLDMLIWARAIQDLMKEKSKGTIDHDEMTFHAISFNIRQFVASVGRVDSPTRNRLPQITWDILDDARQEFEENPLDRKSTTMNTIAREIVPLVIPILVSVIPREDEI